MFGNRFAFGSQLSGNSLLSSYGPRVRAAHELADLLKRTRPHLYDTVCELQGRVTQCQKTLDEAKCQLQQRPTPSSYEDRKLQNPATPSREILTALEELELTTQALLDLRHKGQMAR